MTSTPGSSASRAISYFTERAEDYQAALVGVLAGSTSGGQHGGGPAGADRYLAQVDVGAVGDQGLRATRNKLESGAEHERIEGLRTVVAMISKSLPAADHLFPSVLKLTSVQSLQVKTLVYLVTLRLAPAQPDVALLSINSFQRDLADPSPLIRGMALRVLSSLGVKMAASIMEMAIARSVRDASFYVRRIAADAIAKCSELAPSLLPSLVPHLSTLLADKHPSVLGSALLAFTCTIPHRYDLLHPHFRRICHALVDIDEWNQPAALRVLASYARLNLPRPSDEAGKAVQDPRGEKKVPGRTIWGTGLDADLELLLAKTQPLLSSRNSASVLSSAHLYLSLLPSASPTHTQLIQPLLRLTRSHASQALVALHFVRVLNSVRPDLFAASCSETIAANFVPLTTLAGEPVWLSMAKLDVLVDLAIGSQHNGSVENLALDELEEAALHRPEAALKAHATGALGRLATSAAAMRDAAGADSVMDRCTQVLLAMLKTSSSSSHTGSKGKQSASGEGDSRAVQRAVDVLQAIVQVKGSSMTAQTEGEPSSNSDSAAGLLVYTLSQHLFRPDVPSASSSEGSSSSSSLKLLGKSSLHDPQARATLFWLLGQYCQLKVPVAAQNISAPLAQQPQHRSLAETVLPEVLRKAALHFSAEGQEAKLAILGMGAKLATFLEPSTEAKATETAVAVRHLFAYILDLARYDPGVDVRDRARFLRGLTAGLESGASNQTQGEKEDEEAAATPGVRLRREQVLKVLFNERPDVSTAMTSPEEGDVDVALLLDPARLALLPAGRSPLLRSSMVDSKANTVGLGLPSWTSSPSALPPASVRDHVVAVEPLAAPASLPSGSGAGAAIGGGARSLSSSGHASPVGGAPSTAAMMAAPPQGKGKYKDLDAFLDEESEEEQESSSREDSSEEEEESEEESDEEGEDRQEDEDESESESESEREYGDEDAREDGIFLDHADGLEEVRRAQSAWAD